MKIKLGVFFGGESVEHEVSIISAIQAINNMDTEKYDIIPMITYQSEITRNKLLIHEEKDEFQHHYAEYGEYR